MKIKTNHLFSLAAWRAGARASARFNVGENESPEMAGVFLLPGLKRRERRAPRHSERGMATVVFIALLAIMLMLVTAETRALIRLHREVKLLEKQQIKRLNGPQTNAIPTTITQVK